MKLLPFFQAAAIWAETCDNPDMEWSACPKCTTTCGEQGEKCQEIIPIDECAEGTHNCEVAETCEDTLEGYKCICNVEDKSLIPNPSFEDRSCCPSFFGHLHCAKTWIQASPATSDYFHQCGNYGVDGLLRASGTSASLPLPGRPGGQGFAGFIHQTGYSEYIGACLKSSMLAGTHYTLNLWVAKANGPPDLDFTVYGSTKCSDLPFRGPPFSCPIGQASWRILGNTAVNIPTDGPWQEIQVSFTPTEDIAAVVLGGGCTAPAKSGWNNYYWVDELTLADSGAFECEAKTYKSDVSCPVEAGCKCKPGLQQSPHKPNKCIPDTHCSFDNGMGAVPGPCSDITHKVTRTNSWTCRDCFNIRINFRLNNLQETWNRHVYLSFSCEAMPIKVAGPATKIVKDGRDFNGNYRYRVDFEHDHVFGTDDRVDINAEFREMGGNPRLQYAWLCPKELMCNPSTIPDKNAIGGTGKGFWNCTTRRSGKTTICRVKCTEGQERFKKATIAKCKTYEDKGRPAGEWKVGKKKKHQKPLCNL